jgi:tRNA-specific adenosine deaminase 3
MEKAIQLSIQAKSKGEIPVGCIIIDPKKNIILSESFDSRNSTKNPLCHAVLNCINKIALLERSNYIKNSVINLGSSSQKKENEITYLCKGYDIFITHEPCIM